MLLEPPKNLVLIGGRGCGKSSIARRIKRINKRFTLFELDALIRYEAGGVSIPQLVQEKGWRHFRDLEYQVVQKVSRFPGGALVDCGGGVVVDLDDDGNEVYSERKMGALKQNGLVVYIQRDIDYLLEKIAGDTNRPALSGQASFAEIMARRDPWYRQAADRIIRANRQSKRELAEMILKWFVKEENR